MMNYLNKAFESYNINLPDEINIMILIKLQNQLNYESEINEYTKQLNEHEEIKYINEERRCNAQLKGGLDPYDIMELQLPYRHLREPIIPNKPVLKND